MADAPATEDWQRAAVTRTLKHVERLRSLVVAGGGYVAFALLFGLLQLDGSSPGWLLWWWWSGAVVGFVVGLAGLGWLVLGRLIDLAGPGPWVEPDVDDYR